MGLLESILGSPTLPEEPEPEPTIDLPEDEYTVAYPVAVHRSQLTAFTSVIDAERETSPLEEPGSEFVEDIVNEAWKKTMPGDKTWEESMEETRSNADQVLTAWLESMDDKLDVIFVPIGATHPLRAALITCETRADNDEDPFTLPDEFMEAVSFMKELQQAEDEKEPVFVHEDQIPSLPEPEIPGV